MAEEKKAASSNPTQGDIQKAATSNPTDKKDITFQGRKMEVERKHRYRDKVLFTYTEDEKVLGKISKKARTEEIMHPTKAAVLKLRGFGDFEDKLLPRPVLKSKQEE